MLSLVSVVGLSCGVHLVLILGSSVMLPLALLRLHNLVSVWSLCLLLFPSMSKLNSILAWPRFARRMPALLNSFAGLYFGPCRLLPMRSFCCACVAFLSCDVHLVCLIRSLQLSWESLPT